MTTQYRKARPELVKLIRDAVGEPKIGCEVGIWRGGISYHLLKEFEKLHLFMIDNYLEIDKKERLQYIKSVHKRIAKDRGFTTDEIANLWISKYKNLKVDRWLNQDQILDVMKKMLKNTIFAANRRTLIVCDSVGACKLIQDESLDFVFIDASHDYNSVLTDIKAWFPKVRCGGLVSGHDYGGQRNKLGYFGVNKAVDEFANDNNYKVIKSSGWIWSFVK